MDTEQAAGSALAGDRASLGEKDPAGEESSDTSAFEADDPELLARI